MTESTPSENTPRMSIDDALETDRVAAEGADSRNGDGYGVDDDIARGGDDATAAEQGNRDEDAMETDEEDPAVEEIIRSEDEDGAPLG